jgi:PAS domain-containing protein
MSAMSADYEDWSGNAPAMGFFTWIVGANTLYGDPMFADIYGLPQEDLAAGIPVEKVIERIDPRDQAQIARSVHDAILGGNQTSSSYRVIDPDGGSRKILSFGRCLRDEEGIPSIFSGAIVEADATQVIFASEPLRAHCRAALELAEAAGEEGVARYLSLALSELDGGSGATKPS